VAKDPMYLYNHTTLRKSNIFIILKISKGGEVSSRRVKKSGHPENLEKGIDGLPHHWGQKMPRTGCPTTLLSEAV
jgi:hypothetical protein